MKSRSHSMLLAMLFGLLLALPAAPAPIAPRTQAVALAQDWGQMPLTFVANQGQMDERVAFTVQGSDKTLYFAADGVTFALADPTLDEGGGRWIVKLDFLDANAALPIGQERSETVVSYFTGPREEWHAGLPTYSRIAYADLWDGITLTYSGTVNRLKHEFVVQPGADPARIRLAYRGATIRLNEAGQLEVSTPAGGFTDDAPLAYQEVNGRRVPVAVRYALADDATYGFRLGDYDPGLPLVIDPVVLIHCGYIGGVNDDRGNDIAVDAMGNAYITGWTKSSEATFPVTIGPDLTWNDSQSDHSDAFVAKVDADGTGLAYAGYIGGDSWDYGNSIAVDTAGNAYITGFTLSDHETFPASGGPDSTYNGYGDAFVAKVSANGTTLVYCGYLGGDDNDEGNGIAVDAAGYAYVVGSTSSAGATFPVHTGPDLTYNSVNSEEDAFVAKVQADGTGLVYCGYVGGIGRDYGNGVAVDADGYAYVVGSTTSTEATFPVAVGPDPTYNGGDLDGDAFVAKVQADGTALVYAGYIGGSEDDYGLDVAGDTTGNAYITGWTASTEATFPVTVGPDLTHNDSDDVFVAKVNAGGTALAYCGYVGGGGQDQGTGIAVDTAGNAYVTGVTRSNEDTFPVVGGPDLTYSGGGFSARDAFVAQVQAGGTGLVYCGYIGGGGDWFLGQDYGEGIALDPAGNAYVVGYTNSTQSFPLVVGPDLTYNGSYDAFVAKVSPDLPPDTELPTLPDDPITGSPLITPTLGVTVHSPRPRFDWTDGVDNVGVVSYTLVITDEGALGRSLLSTVYQVTTAESEYTPTWGLPNGDYTWSVQAHDAAGNASLWVEPQPFTVDAVIHRVFLPLVARGLGSCFSDDFDPGNGWYVGQDTGWSVGYLNGEYQILITERYAWAVGSPLQPAPSDYRLEVDARLASGAQGLYGLGFGADLQGQTSYLFLIYPVEQAYEIIRQNADGTQTTLEDEDYNPVINAGTATNRLRIDRIGSSIHAYVNGVLVATWDDDSFMGAGLDYGLFAASYGDDAVDARFDNFSACPARLSSPLYVEGFDVGGRWYEGDKGWAQWSYQGAEYEMLIRNTDSWAYSSVPLEGGLPRFALEADMRFATSALGGYGLNFDQVDSNHLYSFVVKPGSQQYGLWKFAAPTWTPLVNWTTSASIYAGTATNRLRVERDGEQIRLYANGVLLNSLSDASYLGNQEMSLYAASYGEGSVAARYDNFTFGELP